MEGREPSYKSEEQDEFYNSNESLHELQQFVRKRTISGTHSDRSTGSLKELIFIKSIHEHQTIGNEGRVSVQGVKSLSGHFACLCRGFEIFFVIIFQKENGNTFTFLIIFIKLNYCS